MGAYVIGDDGVLARHPMSSSEELRPLERAALAADLAVPLAARPALDAARRGDQDQAHHLRREQAVLDHPRGGAQPGGELARDPRPAPR